MFEPFFVSYFFQGVKLFRGSVFCYRQVVFGGSEILADGDHVAVDISEVIHGLYDFTGGFAQPHHDT